MCLFVPFIQRSLSFSVSVSPFYSYFLCNEEYIHEINISINNTQKEIPNIETERKILNFRTNDEEGSKKAVTLKRTKSK